MKTKTKKRIKTTVFWSAIASAGIVLAENVAKTFGYEIPASTVANILTDANGLLALLSFAGVLVDSKEVDSFQAMVTKIRK
jgi:uncharacterized membrane protein